MKKLLNNFLFDKQKTLLALEYGLVFSDTARKMKIKITAELVEKLEEMILGEFPHKSPTRLSIDMIPNILSVFELDLSK